MIDSTAGVERAAAGQSRRAGAVNKAPCDTMVDRVLQHHLKEAPTLDEPFIIITQLAITLKETIKIMVRSSKHPKSYLCKTALHTI